MKLTILSESFGDIERVERLTWRIFAPDLDSLVVAAADDEPPVRRPSRGSDPVGVVGERPDELCPLHRPKFDGFVIRGGHQLLVVEAELDTPHPAHVASDLAALPLHVRHPEPDGLVPAGRGHQVTGSGELSIIHDICVSCVSVGLKDYIVRTFR